MSLTISSVVNRHYAKNKLEIVIEGKLNGFTVATIPNFFLYIFPDCSNVANADVLVNASENYA